jgi:hypothetical protein
MVDILPGVNRWFRECIKEREESLIIYGGIMDQRSVFVAQKHWYSMKNKPFHSYAVL